MQTSMGVGCLRSTEATSGDPIRVREERQMVFQRTTWKCEQCGHEHRTNRKQCVYCGFIVLEPVESGMRQLNRTLTAALPALLTAILMALMAVVLFL